MKAGRVGLAVGLVVFLAAMGSGVSYALWSTTASTSAQVKAATVIMNVDGAAAATALSVQYQPGQSLTSALTLANGGSAAFTYNVAVTPNGGTLSHASVSIALWKVAAAASCTAAATVPSGAWTGTLATLAAHAGEAMAVSGSQVLCVRTTMSANVTSAQQGQAASANLSFTATNGWVSSKSVAISPSLYTVPTAQFPTTGSCSTDPQEMTMTLSWLSAGSDVTYRLEFSPAASPVVIQNTAGLLASFDASSFTHKPGPGTVTLRTVAANGWVSQGKVMNIVLANLGNSEKLRCS